MSKKTLTYKHIVIDKNTSGEQIVETLKEAGLLPIVTGTMVNIGPSIKTAIQKHPAVADKDKVFEGAMNAAAWLYAGKKLGNIKLHSPKDRGKHPKDKTDEAISLLENCLEKKVGAQQAKQLMRVAEKVADHVIAEQRGPSLTH